MTVTIEEASAQLAQLLAKAASGEEVYISRTGEPAIRLMPVAIRENEPPALPLTPRVPGLGKGQVWIAPDFDSPMPDDWPAPDAWKETIGMFDGDALFKEISEAGKSIRESQRDS